MCNNSDSCYDMRSSVVQHVQSYDTGAFILDSNFNVLGDLSVLQAAVNGSAAAQYAFDVPADKLSVSPVIESRSFSATYVYLPTTTTSMPSWDAFVALNPRNARYSAEYGAVSPQAYKQQLATAQAPLRAVCSSNSSAAVPGSHFCTILENYQVNVNTATGLATLSPVRWSVAFEITALSGQYFDTVDLSNHCPVVSLDPTASGALGLALQNDDTVPTQLLISYQPIDSVDSGIPCPSACCLTDPVQLLAQPRFVTYFTIPRCGWVNLTITVYAKQLDGSNLACFNASGQSLYANLQTASTALGVNFFDSVNVTEVYANAMSNYYSQRAAEALLEFMQFVSDSSAQSLQAIAALRTSRDSYIQAIADAQQLAPVPTTYPINQTLLLQRVDELLTQNNTAIDNDVLYSDLPYIREQADSIKDSDATIGGQECNVSPLTWVGCAQNAAGAVGNAFIRAGQAAGDAINALFDDKSCPTGWENIVHPIDALSCLADDLVGIAIGIGVVLVVGLLVVCCAPNLIGFLGHKLNESAEKYREVQAEKEKQQAKAKPKARGKKGTKGGTRYDQVSEADDSDDDTATSTASRTYRSRWG